jgi:hypothetical protein
MIRPGACFCHCLELASVQRACLTGNSQNTVILLRKNSSLTLLHYVTFDTFVGSRVSQIAGTLSLHTDLLYPIFALAFCSFLKIN